MGAIAGLLGRPDSSAAAPNATYGTKAEVAEKVDKTVADTSYVPAELAVTFIYHGSNGSTPRGDAPGRRIWVGTVLPAGFQEGVDLLMRPATSSPGDLPSATLVEDLPATGLQSVWDADTIGLASGSTVATWTDQVGTVHMSGISGPTVNTDAGRTFVATDGTASYVQATSGLVVGQPLTIAVVGRYVTAVPGALMLISTASTSLSVGVNSTGFMYSYAGASVPGPPVDDQWHVFLIVHNSPTSELRIDDAVAASGDFGIRGMTGGIQIGAGGPNGRTGLNIAAVAVWNRALTTQERADVSATLAARYAIGA